MKYKCIIFDCDGVLVDSESISNFTLIEMAKTIGETIDEEYAMTHFLGKSLTICFGIIENLAGKRLPENFEEEFRLRTFDAFKTQMKPILGVLELIPKLKVDFCVASNGPAEKIILNLTTSNLIHHFEGKIFSAYDINCWKPNPELYLHAAKTMGYEIHECVVIEDSPTGIRAAKTGGFKVYGLVNDYNKEQLEAENIPLFNNMAKLQEILNQ